MRDPAIAAKVITVTSASTATIRKRDGAGHRLLSAHDAHSEGTEVEAPGPLSHRRTVKSRCDLSWVAQVRADVEPVVDADRDHVAPRRLSGPGMRARSRVVQDV
jgi:hypothetical protein